MTPLLEQIKATLQEKFSPTHLEIIDETHLHTHHPHYQSGKVHLRLYIDGPYFKKHSLIEKQRCIYQALSPFWDQIHALSFDK